MGKGGGSGISKNVTDAASKLTFAMGVGGGAGISKNVTTDLLDVYITAKANIPYR